MPKLKLPTITLIAVAGNKQSETITSLYKSMAKIDFASVKLITNIDLKISDIECINVGGLDSWDAYNKFIVKELYKYFDTKYCLIVQWDSWVLDEKQWDDKFLDYDLVGAKWLELGTEHNVGNGGFTLRSHRLQKILGEDSFINICTPEDVAICKIYSKYLKENYNIKYCTEEIADKFAFELNQPTAPTFGFHAFHHQPYKETVVIKRSGAMGDVIMAEPLLHYYHKKGYRVVLDTKEEYWKVYFQHYFPVYPKQALHPKIKYKEINLDMSYEIQPKKSVLEAYYEVANIKDGEIRNSRLTLFSGQNEKMFDKYALIHIDSTGMPYRDAHFVDWKKVVTFLENYGYKVFQIGRRVDVLYAPHLNTFNTEFMMFIIKNCDLFIGLDSGCAQVAVGFNVPSVIFFGSVNPKLRYNDFSRISVVQSECPIEEKKHCYHEENARVIGSDCTINKALPPCTQYTAEQVIEKIKQLFN